MSFFHPSFLLILILLLLSSCASFDLQYAKKDDFVKSQATKPNGKLTHTMFLIGDAGNAAPGSIPPAVQLLGDKLKAIPDPKESSVVFLGDNLYPNGFAPKREVAERQLDEHRLKVQLDAVKDFKGKVFFVPGNHDWYNYGIDGLKRERNFIEEYLGREDVWLPKPGCGDPVEVELNDNLVLILIDSEWWLTDWDGHTEINAGCEVKSRATFSRVFEEAIKGNRNKNIVVAMHHPLYSYGSHGGAYPIRDHLFPLAATNPKLKIPLPVVGSLYPFLRSTIGSREDLSHPDYKSLKKSLIGSAQRNGSFIFAAGHEHTLQYVEQDEQSFIVSGAGSKLSPVQLGTGSEFAYGYYGFAQLDFYDNGAVWLKFWTPEGDDPQGRLVFQKQIKAALPKPAALTRDSFAEYLSGKTVVKKPLSAYNFEKTKLWRAIWGEHYRKAYATPVEIPTLDLTKYAGGLKPTKLGGGYQTNSLRLTDKAKREYAIRSIDKDASRTLPFPFNESFVSTIIQDNFSASHPMAALPVAKLANAAGVYHTDPQVYYVPKQPALEGYNELFGGGFYQVEKRPNGDWSDAANFGNAKDFESTADVVDKITGDHDHRIDYDWVLRSRLLDVLIGDWDRHDDQWRWAEFEKDKKKIYRPIPRDRDQAFSNYDGFLISFIRQFTPPTRQYLPYTEKMRKIQWSVGYNTRNFDPTFLNTLEWEAWLPQIQRLQASLTDSVIENAFRQTFPPEIFQLNGQNIIKVLKARRDNLPSIARRHYEFVSRKVDIVGTDKREFFEIVRISNDSTRATVYAMNKDGDRQEKRYERTFHTKETKEIRLYGLDGDDVFQVDGITNKGILVRLIGGLGEDVFYDNSKVRLQKKRTIIYDAEDEKNQLNVSTETKKRLSDNPDLNTYNRKAPDYEFDYGFKSPFLSVNPDDGLLLGGIAQYITYGFKKAPYSTKNGVSLRYAFETSGWSLRYNGEYINVLGKWDLLLDAQFNTPLYAINYYGLGNETPDYEQLLSRDDEEDDAAEDYVRVRQRLFKFEPALLRRVNSAVSWSIGPTFESIRIERTKGRLIDEVGDNFDPELFDGLEILGIRFKTKVESSDNPAFPTRGIGWHFDAGWKMQLDNPEKNFPYLGASLSLYQRLTSNGRLVAATRIGVHHNFNDKFEFFQGATLGSGISDYANFRGVRRERFTGQTAFYNNIDLRLRLINSANRSIPFSMGIFGGFDHGRVWVKDENSKVWHYAYGGGVFFTPFDLVTIQGGVFRSDDDFTRFTLGGGFFF